MGVRVVFYFILQLPWLISAATQVCSNACDETCGNVSISYLFGIRSGCYYNSWFKVTCNETANGKKPLISRINLELVNYWAVENLVVVNNPVIYLNCGNKRNTSPSSVNLQGSPFFFSSRFNRFESVGCGNSAVVFRNNQTNPISSCLQKSCGDLASKLHGCLAIISENITSYTASMTETVSTAGSNRCTSAFIFTSQRYLYLSRYNSYGHRLPQSDSGLEFPDHICIDTTHVLAALEWDSGYLEAALCRKRDTPDGSCTKSCGNVDIPYPFGTEVGCYMNEGFRVTCNETNDGPKPYITSIGTPFLFSALHNRFVSVGCDSLATFHHSPTDDYPLGGCLQPICANFGTSNVSCSSDIPSDLSSYTVNMKEVYPSNSSRRSCGSAFIVDQRYLETLTSNRNAVSNRTLTHVPTTLQWSTPIRGWCDCRDGPNVSSSLDGQYRWTYLGLTYFCVCATNDDEFVSTDKCRDESTPCLEDYRYSYMLCLNTPGNNCSLSCPKGYSGDVCVPIENVTVKSHFLEIIIGCSISLGTLFMLLCTRYLYKELEIMKSIDLKKKYFKRNGGLLLQQLSSNERNVEKVRLFTSKELEKATDYFNENRILGHGGQGTVFKGMLTDGSIVAIKKSNMMDEKKSDETKRKQFINEVMLLSQINHRNVVKLLGCCLETKVPLLVYEFIPNGTLSHLLHEPNEDFPLTWEKRLQIAVEIANALSYLHSAASENSLLDIVDPKILNGGPGTEIVAVAKLAKRCLNLNGKKRPTMKEVAMVLEQIRSSEGANAVEQNTDGDSDLDNMSEHSGTASCSLSSSIENDSATFSLDA
ncbi:hypothetical protein V6N12_027658 [Hibiscus sabdariffa]|uniref:Protein kinase domain-containing protein n=1 Tax=Hibiscus sabdariffa TaxID=183260 RepID=A0ABR2F3K6_9ROSI